MTAHKVSEKRVDALAKVTGKASYAADARPEGCLIALALRATTAPALILSIDVTGAQSIPGVVDVFTHNDVGRLDWTSSRAIDALGAEHLGRDALGDPASRLPAYRPLMQDHVYFAGQWIAIVVATSIEAARAGLGAINVDLEALPFVPSDPIRPGPFFAGDMQHAFKIDVPTGPISVKLKETYKTPLQLHQPMEPSATTAFWDGDSVTLYDSTQGVQASRNYIAESLGVSRENVRVISPYVGGGFGAKNQIWPHQAMAAHLARTLGKPVCLQLTRADMAVASGNRSATRQIIELQADEKGRLGLLRHESHVATSLLGGFFEPCGLNSLLLYTAKKIDVSHYVQREPVPTPTPFRGPGETPGSFALETALDELAHRLDIDPVALRLRNFAQKDYYHDRDWSSNGLANCYRIGADHIDWELREMAPRKRIRNGRLVGLGMATTAYPSPAMPASVRVTLFSKGELLIETSATDIGTGMRTLLAQEVAASLGMDIACVVVKLGDSSLPDAPTAGRSKSTASVLPAALQACRNLTHKLDQIAPPASGNIACYERLRRAEYEQLMVEGQSAGTQKEGGLSFYSFGAHFVEVELDEMIGRLRVTRVVSALDCGRILNPKLAESQIKGAVIFGIGMALMEEGIRHPQRNRIISDNLADYAVPVHADVPEIDVIFTDQADTAVNELGARGLGEIGLPGLAAAIGNAVFNASGRRGRSLPLSLAMLTPS